MDLLRKLFGLGESSTSEPESADAKSVREIAARLEALPLETARRVAAFAYVLGRAAHADGDTSATEVRRMIDILVHVTELSRDQATLVVDAARHQNALFGSTQDFLVTRQFRDQSSPAQRQELLDCAFAVTAADDSISSVEEAEVRRIADELGFRPDEYVSRRSHWNAQRDVLKNLPDST